MGYLDELRAFVSENEPEASLTKPTEPSFVSFVGAPPARNEQNPTAALRDWHSRLSRVDQFCTPPGWLLDNWLKLTDTALWLYESHASYAVRNGWTALDLFGVREGMPGLGGLADQLDGARNLKLDGGKAYWSHLGVRCRMNVGCGDGCVLLWEMGK